jgi:hypothetical protein
LIFAFYGNRIDNRWSGFGKAGIRPMGTDWFSSALVTLNWHMKPDPGELIFYSYFPEMTRARNGMYWGNFFYQNDPHQAIQPGRWYCLELELRANAPGARDGFQRMWIDDVLKGEVLSMRWRDTTDVRINALQLTFSGEVTVSKRVWIDNVVVQYSADWVRGPYRYATRRAHWTCAAVRHCDASPYSKVMTAMPAAICVPPDMSSTPRTMCPLVVT